MNNRNSALDFLRFVAILLVLFRHLIINGNGLPERVASVLETGGWVGVDLFFVLSGFLVSGLIFKEYDTYGTFNPWRFLIRRGFKIYPTFYLFLGLTWGLTYFFHYSNHESNIRYLNEALFICNYTSLQPMHSWIWSICVEEHFYILLCILLYSLIKFNKISRRTFSTIYFMFLVLGLTLRAYNLLHYPSFNFFRDMTQSHLRFDALFFGVVLCFHYRRDGLAKWKSPVLALFAVGIISLPFIFSLNDSRYTFFIVVLFLAISPLCFGYLMILMLRVKAGWMRPFAYIGKYSYSIYLFHGFINDIAGKHFTGWKYPLVYLSASLLVGIIISKLVEYPILALRNKWFPDSASRSSTKPAVPVPVIYGALNAGIIPD